MRSHMFMALIHIHMDLIYVYYTYSSVIYPITVTEAEPIKFYFKRKVTKLNRVSQKEWTI